MNRRISIDTDPRMDFIVGDYLSSPGIDQRSVGLYGNLGMKAGFGEHAPHKDDEVQLQEGFTAPGLDTYRHTGMGTHMSDQGFSDPNQLFFIYRGKFSVQIPETVCAVEIAGLGHINQKERWQYTAAGIRHRAAKLIGRHSTLDQDKGQGV